MLHHFVINYFVSESVHCFCVWSVPLRDYTCPLSDWVSCFGLASKWNLLIGPHCQLATSKTVSPYIPWQQLTPTADLVLISLISCFWPWFTPELMVSVLVLLVSPLRPPNQENQGRVVPLSGPLSSPFFKKSVFIPVLTSLCHSSSNSC